MKILFFTKSKPYTFKTLQELKNEGHYVAVVCKLYEIFENSEMYLWCKNNSVPIYENDELYTMDMLKKIESFDLGIVNTYGRLIKYPVINALKKRIFNIHTAPLPEYKGLFAYNWAIYNEEREWKVTAHYVNEKFDDGKIIRCKTFPIDIDKITVRELENKSQKIGYELTMEIVKEFENDRQPDGTTQKGIEHYYSRCDFENLKIVRETDSVWEIRKKIHACYCPPYEGAYWLKDNQKFTLLPSELLGMNECCNQ